jgi:hypothetical protein
LSRLKGSGISSTRLTVIRRVLIKRVSFLIQTGDLGLRRAHAPILMIDARSRADEVGDRLKQTCP